MTFRQEWPRRSSQCKLTLHALYLSHLPGGTGYARRSLIAILAFNCSESCLLSQDVAPARRNS